MQFTYTIGWVLRYRFMKNFNVEGVQGHVINIYVGY